MKDLDNAATGEFILASVDGGIRSATTSSTMHVDVHGLSHRGLVRSNNEDQFLTCRFGRQLEIVQTTLLDLPLGNRFNETGHAMVVADGMGGPAAGEVASQLAMHSLLDLVVSTPDWILRSDDDHWSEEIARRFKLRASQINQKLVDAVETDPELRGFGTTMTVAWNLGHDLFIANIGDSRAYLYRGHQLHQITCDHTLAHELVDRGVLSQSDESTHRFRHVLTKCLGGDGQSFEPDVQKVKLNDGDCLLLCSDGLTEMVASQAIGETLDRNESVEQACQQLVEQALDAGGKDNITVVVARYQLFSAEPVTRVSHSN